MELKVVFLTGLRQFFQHIALERRGVDDIVVRLLGAEHREPVVMARREADISCA